MRITDAISYRNMLAGVESLNDKLEQANEEVSSGKKLLTLHDSPADSAENLQLNNQLGQLDQYQSNSDASSFYLQVTDSSLNSLYNLVTSVYSQGSAAASNFNDANARASYAADIRSQLDQALSLANTQVRGRYIFAGSKVTAPAFTAAGDTVTYQGDNKVNTIDIGEGLQVHENVTGSDAFSPVFTAISGLLSAIDSGDQGAMQTALSQFSGTLATVNNVRSQLGVDLASVQNSATARQAEQTDIQQRQSTISSADMAVALTQVTQTQTALQAALSVGAVLGKQNLFDYLG